MEIIFGPISVPDPGDSKNSGRVAFSFFTADTNYFQPSQKEFVLNLRVNDLASIMAFFQKEKIGIVGERDEYEYGKFGWIMNAEGNKIELWEEKTS